MILEMRIWTDGQQSPPKEQETPEGILHCFVKHQAAMCTRNYYCNTLKRTNIWIQILSCHGGGLYNFYQSTIVLSRVIVKISLKNWNCSFKDLLSFSAKMLFGEIAFKGFEYAHLFSGCSLKILTFQMAPLCKLGLTSSFSVLKSLRSSAKPNALKNSHPYTNRHGF